MSIKLIGSDVDGTLLQMGRDSLTHEQLDVIDACTRKGIYFAVISGRQYSSLRQLFASLQNKILFVAENGALVIHQQKPIFTRPIPRNKGLDVIRTITAHKNHEVLLSGTHTCYVRRAKGTKLPAEVERLENAVTYVDDFESIEDDFLKISAFLPDMDSEIEYVYYENFWKNKLYCTVSGRSWIDFGSASKGTALRFLQRHFGINRDQTITFGDNFNDTEMFLCSGQSYAMQNASDGVKAKSTHIAASVEEILHKLLNKT